MELLRSIKDDEWENDVNYEDYLYEEDRLFHTGNKIYCERTSLLTEKNRNETLKEIKVKNEKIDNESIAIAGQKKGLEDLIGKLIMTIGYDGNSRMWGQCISQFQESIHKGTNLTPTREFMHLLSSWKGEAGEQISELMVNEGNYALVIETLYGRCSDKKRDEGTM
uniref:Death domain-containing protein n=1 Tax=Loa loa TaxID=7209 RepID=A0A1I7W5T2_LOALO